jgi:O-antigen/teichoic acid export membrane protein
MPSANFQRSTTPLIFALKVLGGAAAYAASVLVARLFGLATLGDYGLMTTLLALATAIATLGVPVFLMNQGAAHGVTSVTMSASARTALSGLATGVAVTLPAFAVIAYMINSALAFYFVPALIANAILLSAQPLWSLHRHFLSGALFIDLARPAVFLAGTVIAMLASAAATEVAVSLIAGALSLTLGAVGIYKLLACWRLGQKQTHSDGPRLRGLYGVTASVVPVGIATVLVAQVDRLYLAVLVSRSDLGTYVAAQSVVVVVTIFIGSVLVQVIPTLALNLATNDWSVISAVCRRAAKLSIAANAVAIVGFLLFDSTIQRLFGIEDAAFSSSVLVLLTGSLFSLFFGFGSTLLLYEGTRCRQLLLATLGAATLTSVAVGVALVPSWGVVGAALGTAIGLILQRALPYVYYRSRGIQVGLL